MGSQLCKSKKGRWVMLRKVLMLMTIVLGVWACSAQGGVIDSNWVGGEWGDWETPSNWSPAIVPENGANTFNVTIDAGAGRVGVRLLYDHVINTLACKGNEVGLEGDGLSHVTLTLTDTNYAPLTDNGELEITGWGLEIFEIRGNVANSNGGLMDFWGGRVDGNLVNPAGATIEVNGQLGIEGDCQNAGLVIVAPYHDFDVDQSLSNTGKIRIIGGGCGVGEVLVNDTEGEITGFGVLYGGERLTNAGTIRATGGNLAAATGAEGVFQNEGTLANAAMSLLNVSHLNLLHYGSWVPSDVNNTGTVEVNAGGGVAFDCNLVNEPNGVIELLGGTLSATTITQAADANFAGFGTITGDVVIEPNGLIQLTGPTNIVGDMQIGTAATLEISDGTTLITGYTTNNGTIHMKGGRIIPQGGFTNNGNIIWEPGPYNNIADFNLDGQVNFKDFADFADTWLWQAQL